MNEKFSKLRQNEEQSHQQTQGHGQEQKAQQFQTVEEMLKADAAEVEVPRHVGERLNRSIAEELKGSPDPSWWKRLFRK